MAKNKVTALDIGSRSISVLIGSKGVNNTFITYGYGNEEYAGYYEGEFLEEDKLFDVFSKALSSAQSSANIRVDKLYIGVPADFMICRTKSFTQSFGQKIKLRQEDINYIYKQAGEDGANDDYVLISCSPISFVLDDGRKTYKVVGQKTSKLSCELSLIYAEKKFIEKINSILQKLGIITVEYLASPLCESLYLLSDERREDTAVIIDCGYINTTVMKVKGQGLVDLKSFAVGGAHISADLMECLQLTFDEAENLRKQLVLTVVPTENDDYEIAHNGGILPVSMKKTNEVATLRLEMLAGLIKKCVQKEGEEFPQVPFYLTGGGVSYIKGGKEILGEFVGTNINLLYPSDVHLAKPHYSSLLGVLDKALKQETKKSIFEIFKKKL